MDDAEQSRRPSWRIRRRIIAFALSYCAIMVAYLSIAVEPTALREQAVTGLIFLAGSIIGSYVFGAVWDDKGRRQ